MKRLKTLQKVPLASILLIVSIIPLGLQPASNLIDMKTRVMTVEAVLLNGFLLIMFLALSKPLIKRIG